MPLLKQLSKISNRKKAADATFKTGKDALQKTAPVVAPMVSNSTTTL